MHVLIHLLVAVVHLVHCQIAELNRVIYQGISADPVVKILNAQGEAGSTVNKTSVGILYKVNNNEELAKYNSIDLKDQFTLVMPISLLNMESLQRIKGNGKTVGILLITNLNKPDSYSNGAKIPNLNHGLYAKDSNPHIWNPNGNELLGIDLGIPVFEIADLNSTDSVTSQTLHQALEFNHNGDHKQYPLYAMEFQGFMYSIKDTTTCLRRSLCKPIGEKSVWSTFSNKLDKADTKPIIILATKIDANALVHERAFGASSKTGMVLMLAVANALSQLSQKPDTFGKHIMFTFFGAESWSFAGSQRFVEDITSEYKCKETSESPTLACSIRGAACSLPCFQRDDFKNINFNAIETIIEFDTIGFLNTEVSSNPNYFAHVDQVNEANNIIISSFQKTMGIAKGFNGTADLRLNLTSAFTSDINRKLPPSSLMSFLAKRQIPSVLISDYQTSFSNKYYETSLDDGKFWSNAHISALCGLADSTIKTLFTLATGNTPPIELQANCTLVHDLLDCVTRNYSCPIMKSLLPNTTYSPLASSYSNVFKFEGPPNLSAFLINKLMTNYTGFERGSSCVKDSDCKSPSTCVAQICVNSMTRYHDAYGTGLSFNYAKLQWEVQDSSKGTWTESDWDITQIRIFKYESPGVQTIQLIIGIAVTLISIVIIIGWQKVFTRLKQD
ncbi:Nicastrin-domain-containing protein [Globomyces pollinis-pini]|nr:Nicastrin-domain-containing protein [Globomyces pollinis-pini]